MRRRPVQPDPYLPVLYSGSKATLVLARCLLDSAEIPYAVTSDFVEDLFGWGRIGSTHNFATGPAEVVVNRNDAEIARELLADLAGYIPPWRPLWLRWFARLNLLLSATLLLQTAVSWFYSISH